MSVLTDIQARLIAQSVGTSANVFATYLNDSPDAAILLVQGSGQSPVKVMADGSTVATYERPTVTVYARGTTSAAAEALLAAARAALEVQDTTLSGTLYIRIMRMGEAQLVGWSSTRVEWSQQFSVERRV